MSEPVPTTSNATSNVRGIGCGCLYALGSWIFVGILSMLIIPAVFRGEKWNHEAIGGAVSTLSLLIVAIPLGVYGFMRHRRPRAHSPAAPSGGLPKH